MIFHKFELNDRSVVTNELYEDELVTYCGDCGKELEIGIEDINHIHNEGADFAGTTFYCNGCTPKANDAQ